MPSPPLARPQVLVAFVGMVVLFIHGACAPGPSPAPTVVVPMSNDIEAGTRAVDSRAITTDRDAAVRERRDTVPLRPADCLALRDAGVLALAVVTKSEPDCSGVGHQRIVLEVRRLGRGQGVSTIIATRTLGLEGTSMRVGDAYVASVREDVRPAELVYCVAIPPRQGVVLSAVAVSSLAEGENVLDALVRGAPCEAEPTSRGSFVRSN